MASQPSGKQVDPVISPGLINPDWDDPKKFVFNPDFDLGMGDWLTDVQVPANSDLGDMDETADWLSQLPDLSCIVDESSSAVPSTSHGATNDCSSNPAKRIRLSLNRKAATTRVPLMECTNQVHGVCSRFAKPVVSPEREKAAKGVVPPNTEASTQWALRNYNAWALNRSFMTANEAVPADLLQSHDANLVCKWLCRFVMETRKTDGSEYPPATLRSLVSGLNRVLQSNKAPFSVLDKSDYRFRDLLKTLDSLSSELHRRGIGATKDSAKVIDPKHEDIFWEIGLLGYTTPKIIQRTVFFYVGLNFVLRGVQEQYNLVPSQFVRVPEDKSVYDASVYYEYVELISKNNQHRFKDINMKNKCIRAYALPGNERCVVKLLDTYLDMLPPNAPYFYMRALEKFPGDLKKSGITNQRVGVNLLKNILPELSEKSSVGVHYTNHSLRATAITRMFTNGIPEKVIAETSGHRSTKALRCYEHTSVQQQQVVSRVINSSDSIQKMQDIGHPGVKEECKPSIPPPSKEENAECKPVAQSIPPSFSGSFTNCTINISL